MDILKCVGYAIDGTEVAFFRVVLHDDPQLKRIVPTMITLADNLTDGIKIKMAESLIQYGENIKADIKTINHGAWYDSSGSKGGRHESRNK